MAANHVSNGGEQYGLRVHHPEREGSRSPIRPIANEDATSELEEKIHKTILVGDSGVGKTSLLVQFDQGKFQTGSFSATVGIGFTVSKARLISKSQSFLRLPDFSHPTSKITSTARHGLLIPS